MKQLLLTLISVSVMALFCECGTAIKQAQDFSTNKPPTIESINVVNNTGKVDIIPYSSYPVIVTASDPDNQTLTYTFRSSNGSFASQ